MIKVLIDQNSLGGDLKKLRYLFTVLCILMGTAILMRLFLGELGFFYFIITSIVFSWMVISYKEVFDNLQYSFWGFSISIALYIKYLYFQTDSYLVENLLIASLFILGTLCYSIATPIFYPRIMWWEYDFRFKGDLKIWAHLGNKCVSARLTDLRRKAGCIVMFEKQRPGSEFKIDYKNGDETLTYRVKVMSRRESNLGRGYTYGVQFLLKDGEAKLYKSFSDLWTTKKKARRRLKFAKRKPLV